MLTLLVGLHSVGPETAAPPDLPASWNPRSNIDAAQRARLFALQATTVWTIESVIAYVASLPRESPAVLEERLAGAIREETNKELKLDRLRIGLELDLLDEIALVRAGYVWRNRLIHIEAHNRVNPEVSSHLLASRDQIRDNYQGLDVALMLQRIAEGREPRLKEATALVRASNLAVKSFDGAIVAKLDGRSYMRAVLRQYLLEVDESKRGKRAAGLWGGSDEANQRSLANFVAQMGVARPSADNVELFELARLTPREAVAELTR